MDLHYQSLTQTNRFVQWGILLFLTLCPWCITAQNLPNELQIRQFLKKYETDLNAIKSDADMKTMLRNYFFDRNGMVEHDLMPQRFLTTTHAKSQKIKVEQYMRLFKSGSGQISLNLKAIPKEFCNGSTALVMAVERTLSMKGEPAATTILYFNLGLEGNKWGIHWMGFSKDAPAVLKCGSAPSPCPPIPPPTVCPPCKCEAEKTIVRNCEMRSNDILRTYIRIQGDSAKLKSDYANLEDIVRRARDSVRDLKREKSDLEKILKAIREQIVATVETAQRQKSIFAQNAARLKAEYDDFGLAERKLRDKPATDTSKIPSLARLEKAHTARAVQMWQELRAVGSFQDTTHALLKDVYTWSLPNAAVPKRNNPTIPNDKLPTPSQLLKQLQTAEPICDDANFLQLAILTDYATDVMAVMPVTSQQSDNVSTSLSFHFLSQLLMSNSPNTLSEVKAKISNGLLDDVVLQGYLSEGSSELNRANGLYNEKNYLDALRIYVDYERGIRRLSNKSVQETVKYNYATILLWNLGDFSQKKGLFKGRMKSKVRERVANATRMLNELVGSNNEIGEKARIALSKYGTRNRL